MIQLRGSSGIIAVVGSRSWRGAPLAVLATWFSVAVVMPAGAAVVVQTTTGIRAGVHTVDDVTGLLDAGDGGTWLRCPEAPALELDTTRYPWDGLVPVPAVEVVAALEAMQGFATDVTVDVYLLPGFPVGVWSTFAQGRAIFLAPTFAPTAASTVHYLVTHEMGHVLTAVAIDPEPARWDAYLALRGLDATSRESGVSHAENAREILAEDLRHLFGGHLATLSGTIENSRLPLPDAVPGLSALLVGFLDEPATPLSAAANSRAFPNPCNPQTTIAMDLPANVATSAAQAVLEIVDVRGRLVRRVQGSEVGGATARSTWDGCDGGGRQAPSGVYFYEFKLGDVVARGRVSVIR